jgi:Uma2 family endonuclease
MGGLFTYPKTMTSVLVYPDTELVETDYHAFNAKLWDHLVADQSLAALDLRIETDRYGQRILSPPPAPSHGNRQGTIARLLGNLTSDGRLITECPLSTRDGVKAIDVTRCSDDQWSRLGDQTRFMEAPEICIEVESPSNTKADLRNKKALYFEEGAREVWICNREGSMLFYTGTESEAAACAALVPDFPAVDE